MVTGSDPRGLTPSLRENDVDRELYESAKRELGSRAWKYVQDYADAKSAVVAEIKARTQSR